jgi:aminoglycoside phosphotransferase (APT) family kinase protein
MRLPDGAGVLDAPSDLDRAIAAWRSSGGAPVRRGSCTALKETSKSRVYRLVLDDRAGTAIVAKRRVPAALATDLAVYGVLADQIGVLVPVLHAVVDDPPHRWAFMEDVSGVSYDPRRREHREALADWLADVHRADVPGCDVLPPHLSDRYLGHLRGTMSLLDEGRRNPAVDDQGTAMLAEMTSFLGRLEERWSTFAAFDDVAPHSLVHGDLVAKNVFLRERRGRLVVLPVDWETGGWGTPAADLASWGRGRLTADPSLDRYCSRVEGRFSRDQVHAIANVGVVFRALAAMEWAGAWLRTEWASKRLEHLPALAETIAQVLHSPRMGMAP